MKFHWFVRKGLFFLPASVMGWILFVALVGFGVWAFIDIDGRSHSGSDTLINFFFVMLIAGVFYSFIGWLTEKRNPSG